MQIHPVQGFKNLSTKQKVAAIAGAAVATAAVATTAVAFVKGKGAEGEKLGFFKRIGKGYQMIGKSISEKFGKIKENVKNFFHKTKDEVQPEQAADKGAAAI